MNDIDELVTWLRAQLDEDERVARAADPETVGWLAQYGDDCAMAGAAAHIRRHDPARVLREVEAKRGIVELHSDRDHFCGIGSIERDGYTWHEAGEKRRADIPCLTLRLLALAYADRPGYRAEWRPS